MTAGLAAANTAPEWQTAMEALILVATLGGPTMFARIGVMQALNRHHVREFDPKEKEPRWGKRKLARIDETPLGARSARFTGLFTSNSS